MDHIGDTRPTPLSINELTKYFVIQISRVIQNVES